MNIDPNHINEPGMRVYQGPNGQRIILGSAFPGIHLTGREAEVSQLLEKYKYREIAVLMGISRRTVEYYALNIKKKFNCVSKRELVYKLKHAGILDQLKKCVDVSHFFEKESSD